jgi:serine/threonine protein phosphatase PrpC
MQPATSNVSSMPPRQPQQQQQQKHGPTALQLAQQQAPHATSTQNPMLQQQQPQQQQQPFWQGAWSFGACADQHTPPYMEDRHIAVDLSAHPDFAGCHRAGLFAVCDGHGGHQVAEYLQTYFQQRVLSAGGAALAANPQQSLAAAVQQLEQEVLQQFPPECHPGDTVPRAPGSTLCAVLLIDDKLHTVNVGDSRAALVNGTSAVQLTQDHSPACPAERRRISGTDPDAISKYDDYIYGSVKLSRGIGCAHLKRDSSDGSSSSAYIATPDVSTRQLQQADDFVVVASDGFWDVADSYVHPARKTLSLGGTAASVASLLVQRAKDLGSRDNVTVVVVLLHDRGVTVPRSNSRLQLMQPNAIDNSGK